MYAASSLVTQVVVPRSREYLRRLDYSTGWFHSAALLLLILTALCMHLIVYLLFLRLASDFLFIRIFLMFIRHLVANQLIFIFI